MNMSTKIFIGILLLVVLLVVAEIVLTTFFMDEFAPRTGHGR